MNPEVGRLLLILGESQVQLEPRRRWAAHHPPGFMEEVTFLFNGHRDLGSHLKALEKAMEEAKQQLIQAIVYREPDHPMSWEEGQILIATIAALEGSLTSRRRSPLTTSTIHGAVDKLDTEQWQSLEQDVRQFIEQQYHVFVQLKSTVDAFRSEFDSLSRGREPRPNLWRWAGSEVQMVELFYALTQVGALVWTGDKLPNEEMAGEFAHLFRTEVRHVDSTISRMLKRQTGPAKFMMQCAQHLERVREMREA